MILCALNAETHDKIIGIHKFSDLNVIHVSVGTNHISCNPGDGPVTPDGVESTKDHALEDHSATLSHVVTPGGADVNGSLYSLSVNSLSVDHFGHSSNHEDFHGVGCT